MARRIVALLLGLGALLTLLYVLWLIEPNRQLPTLQGASALWAVTLLYLSLLYTPLYTVFPKLPYRAIGLAIRRPLGVGAFLFGLLHGALAFFVQLDGYYGLTFLTSRYQAAVALGMVALFFMGALALTASDWAVRRLGFVRWKGLHRLVYLASLAVLIHALMLGDRLSDPGSPGHLLFAAAVAILMVLQGVRVFRFVSERWPRARVLGLVLIVLTVAILSSVAFTGLTIHSTHQP